MGIAKRYGNIFFHPAIAPERLVNEQNAASILETRRLVTQRDAMRLLDVYKAHVKSSGHVIFTAYAENLARLREVFAVSACSNFADIERRIDVTTQAHIHNTVYGAIGREMAKIVAELEWNKLPKDSKAYEATRMKGIGYDTSMMVRRLGADLISQELQAILFKASLSTHHEKAMKKAIKAHAMRDEYAKLQQKQVGIALAGLFAELTIMPQLKAEPLAVRATSDTDARERRELLHVLGPKVG